MLKGSQFFSIGGKYIMSQKPKRCQIKNLIKIVSKLSGKSLSEVEDEMFYCNLYPENEQTCIKRFIMSEIDSGDCGNWFNNTLNRILDINNIECLYIIKNEKEGFNLEKTIDNFETLTILGKHLFDDNISGHIKKVKDENKHPRKKFKTIKTKWELLKIKINNFLEKHDII